MYAHILYSSVQQLRRIKREIKMTTLSQEISTKAKWVADMMIAEGVTASQLTPELIEAYMIAIGKKIAQIQSIYLTNSAAREAFGQKVLSVI